MTFACERVPTGAAAVHASRTAATVPQLETARLVLRAPCIGDFATYAAIVNSPRGRFLDIQTREDAWLDFAQMTAGWMLQGHGLWSVVAKSDVRLLGFVMLGFEPEDPEPELGFIFTETGEGQGYAHEAALAARDFAYATLGWTTLVSFIDPANTRSRNLAERLGAQSDTEITDASGTTLVFRHPTPEAL